MIAYTPSGPDFFPRAALSEAAGQEVYLAHEGGAFVVVAPPGIDWADYQPQPDLEVPQPDDEEGNPVAPALVPQPDLRIPRAPWAYYSGDPQPTPEWVAAWRPADNSPPPAPVSEAEVQFKKIQQRLDYNEFLRTGRAVDPRGAVSVARAWAAVCMLLNRWHYPTKADLDTDVNKAILQKIYADPTANTNEKSSTAQKQAVLHYTLVMLEGQAFGIDYQAELGAYERTASGAFREKVKSDPRDWLLLPVHKWETCLAMFLEVMG